MESIEDLFIFSSGSLIETVRPYVDYYWDNIKNDKVKNDEVILKTNKFILDVITNIDDIKNNNEDYFLYLNLPYVAPDPNNFRYIQRSTMDEYYKYDYGTTLYQYILLLNKMIKLYDKSFNLNYNLTCVNNYNYAFEDEGKTQPYDIEQTHNIENSFLITQTNILCKYYKVENDEDINIIPVFIGSYQNISDVLFVYNICSDITMFNKKFNLQDFGLKVYKTLDLFELMLYFFQVDSKKDRLALLVETRNPSYSKAYSLYYKAGFRPMFNLLDTLNVNLLELAQNCIKTDINYKNCQKGTFNHILMMKTTDKFPLNDIFIKYYNDAFMSNKTRNTNKISRISQNNNGNKLRYFFDTAVSMAHRCSCIFDKYFTLNKICCEKIVDNITYYFTHNSDYNKNYFQVHWNVINLYEKDALYHQSIGQMTPLHVSFLNNPNLFRFISCVSNNFCDYTYVKSAKVNRDVKLNLDKTLFPDLENYSMFYSDFTLTVGISEIMNTITNLNGSGSSTFEKKISITFYNQNNIDTEKNCLEFNIKNVKDIKDSLRDVLTSTNRVLSKKAFTDLLDKFENSYTDDRYPIIFIPCNLLYECNITGRSNNIAHAVSMVYVKNSKRLFFYESQVLSDDKFYGMIEIVKALSIVLKELIRIKTGDYNSVQDEVHELHRYKDPHTEESLYAKIQTDFSDDKTGALCVLLSKIPYFACNLFPTTSKKIEDSEEYIRFYTFMLTFYAIKIRKEQEILGEQNIVQTNISVVFPYMFCGVYGMIQNFNNKKKADGKTLFQEDIDIEKELDICTLFLRHNLSSLNNENAAVFELNKEELPYTMHKYMNNKIFTYK